VKLDVEKIRLYSIIAQKITLGFAILLGVSSAIKGLMSRGLTGLVKGILMPALFYVSFTLAIKIIEKTLIRRIKLCQREETSKKS
jgi:hypothetical protein